MERLPEMVKMSELETEIRGAHCALAMLRPLALSTGINPDKLPDQEQLAPASQQRGRFIHARIVRMIRDGKPV